MLTQQNKQRDVILVLVTFFNYERKKLFLNDVDLQWEVGSKLF